MYDVRMSNCSPFPLLTPFQIIRDWMVCGFETLFSGEGGEKEEIVSLFCSGTFSLGSLLLFFYKY